jgi:uncharacterized phage infection (PIP) family protein YhgE
MSTLKRILAIAVIVLGVLGILVSLAGIFGTWVANDRVSTGFTYILDGVQSGLQVVDRSLDRINTTVEGARGNVQTITDAATQLETGIKESTPVLDLLSRTVGEELAPKLDSARETSISIRDSVVAFNDTLEAVNTIPGVQVPTLTEELQATSDRLSDASLKAQELRTSITELKAGVAGTLVSPVTDRATRIDQQLAVIQSDIQDYRAEIEARQQAIAQLRKRILFWVDLLSVIATLALLWAGFGQFVLVYLAWKYLKTGVLPYQSQEAFQSQAEVTT